MKKVLFPILALVLAVGLALPMATSAAADMETTDLIAGQHDDVGDVTVWNDGTNLYVQYVVDDPWDMTGSHLYVGKTDPEDFPSTPGQFPYSPDMNKSPSPGASYDAGTMTYTIPLGEIYGYEFVGTGKGKGLNPTGTPGVEPCNDVYIAAHADLEKLGEVMTVTLASGTQTLSAGYTETEPVSDPLNPSNYIPGTWSTAVDLSSPHPSWYNENLLPGAVWVSSADSPEGNTANDQWRLFKEEFEIPAGAIITSASLVMSADNSVEAYLNSTSVGTADDAVFGAAPGPPFSDPEDYHFRFLWGPLDLNPVEGTNTLMFVVRNWASEGDNPTGLIYKLDYEYQLLVTETGWGEGDPFGTNWAMYFSYHIQEPCVSGEVINGGFETPVVTAYQGWDIFPSGTENLGWTVEWYDGSISYGGWTRPETPQLELHNGTGETSGLGGAYEENQYAELDTDWNGHVGTLNNEPASVKIYQDIDTCPGQEYTLSYAWMPRTSDSSLQVMWDGGQVATHSDGTSIWHTESLTVTASDTTTRLEFIETGTPDSLGMFLDAVSLVEE